MSAPVEFVVRGHASRREPAQTGTVTGAVEAVDADPRAVIDRVRTAHVGLVETVEQLREAGALRWSSGELRTWAERPWSADGTQQPVQHHASIGFTAVFVDTDEVGPWLGEVLGRDGLVVHGVGWGLAEERRADLEREVRRDAVLDAVARAQAYADALGLGQVRPAVIADAGMLVAAPDHAAPGAARFALAAAPDAGGLELTPDAIEVHAGVEARFVVGGE